MIGVMPKFMEGRPLPKGYYDVPNPYTLPNLSQHNLREMLAYAKKVGKNINDLTYEEAEQFRVRPE